MKDAWAQMMLSFQGVIVKDPTRVVNIVYTGPTRRSILKGFVTELRKEGKITREEEITLDQMIDSPDEENLTVVETIIEQKYELSEMSSM